MKFVILGGGTAGCAGTWMAGWAAGSGAAAGNGAACGSLDGIRIAGASGENQLNWNSGMQSLSPVRNS